MEEKELLRKKREEIEEAECASRSKVIMTFDLVGRKVLINEDDASEQLQNSILLKPPEEREAYFIKPNSTVQVQPIFVDLGPNKKNAKGNHVNKVPSNGLCLEISGKVQHDTSELSCNMVDDHLGTTSNGNF